MTVHLHLSPALALPLREKDFGFGPLRHFNRQLETILDPLPQGDPVAIGLIEFVPPLRDEAYRLTLTVELHTDNVHLQNQWAIWVYPPITAWPDVGLLDPGGCLVGLDDLYDAAYHVAADDLSRWPDVVIASWCTPELLSYLDHGGCALLIQTTDRPLPTVALPFWREAIKLIGDHPVMHSFPHDGYVDRQFYHLASDRALDTARLADVLPDTQTMQSLLGRLDARVFTWTDYLVELPIGSGKLMATTLNFMGGQGDQVAGLRDNVAGRFLLRAILNYLNGG